MATMFLRTALTEQRIEKLEKQMRVVMFTLGLTDEIDPDALGDLPDRTQPRIVQHDRGTSPQPPDATRELFGDDVSLGSPPPADPAAGTRKDGVQDHGARLSAKPAANKRGRHSKDSRGGAHA